MNRLERKRVGYDWTDTKKPLKIWLDDLDSNGRLIRTRFICDTTGRLGNDLNTFGVVDSDWYYYDDKGRLQSRIAERRPSNRP
jgi:hypothetical protein